MKAIQWMLILICIFWLGFLTIMLIETNDAITTVMKIVNELHK